jgi:AcrR family transcriptional regulator
VSHNIVIDKLFMRKSTKMEKRARGRPRQFDPETALANAISVFLKKGFSGASLDDLAGAMGMNRPSLYRAFGDKAALYRKALGQFAGQMRDMNKRGVVDEPDLRKALQNMYRASLDVYFAETPAQSCLLFCTAPVESLIHPEVRKDMSVIIGEIDAILEAKFLQAQENGQIAQDVDPVAMAKMAQGVLHSIAIRARAGETRTVLDAMASNAVTVMCP